MEEIIDQRKGPALMEDMGDMMAGMALMMGVWVVLVVGLITAPVVAAVRLTRKRSRSPVEQLDRRYARGELTAEEYRQHRDELAGLRWPAPDWPA